jgi:hypothetical protein
MAAETSEMAAETSDNSEDKSPCKFSNGYRKIDIILLYNGRSTTKNARAQTKSGLV